MTVSTSLTRPVAPVSARQRSTSPLAIVSVGGLLPLFIGLAMWQLIGSSSSTSFPVPSTWFRALSELQTDGLLIPAATKTVLTFLVSLITATLLGSAVGMCIGLSRRVERALSPTMEILRCLPPPAVVPAAALLLGVSFGSGVIVVVLTIMWPIVLNTTAGVRAIPSVRSEMGHVLGLGAVDRWRKVLLPSLIPSVFVGVKVSTSIAIIVTLLVEIVGSGEGMGRLLSQRQASYDAPSVWGLLLIIGVFGFVVNALMTRCERRVLRAHGMNPG